MATTLDGVVYDNVLRSCGMLYFHFGWGLALMCLGAVAVTSRLPVRWLQVSVPT